ncbi:5-hydroxymethyl-dUMP N-hydrolase-like [Tubulanus polymorphus]|uniref:5-hydroxymethyl-dUMP N-hydrolase-like n=1 Tax=Tubulanus polymorphus TaxID=672921 RepID=UPI003DA210BE
MSRYIYFCGSIRGGRTDAELYGRLIEKLKTYGTVLTEHVAGKDGNEDGSLKSEDDDRAVHDRDLKWLDQADVVVAEVTQPSLGVGYEIGRAIAMGDKRILCLYRPQGERKLSAMIRGADNGDNVTVKDYKEAEADEIFKDFFLIDDDVDDEEEEENEEENGTE